MALSTSNNPLLRPEEVGDLLVRPVIAASVASQISSVVQVNSHDYRIPVIDADATAGWYAENSEITPSDPTLAEIVVTPSKVAGLVIISRELAEDSSPEAAQIVGESLARDIARKIDVAFFGNTVANGPAGLLSLTTATSTEAATSFTTLDSFAGAIAAAETVGATIGSFVTSPTEALALAKLKEQTGSNRPLLGSDPTAPTARTMYGVPLLVAPSIAAKSAWAIPRDRVFVVIRADARVEVDASVFFTSDRVAVKATMRVGFGFAHPLSYVKITHA